MNILIIIKLLLLMLSFFAFTMFGFQNIWSKFNNKPTEQAKSIRIKGEEGSQLSNITQRILLWNNLFNERNWELKPNPIEPSNLRDDFKCQFTNCQIHWLNDDDDDDDDNKPQTENIKSTFPTFNAVIFNAFKDLENITDLQDKRNESQYFIFANQESPIYTLQKLKSLQNFYNLTMTYRLDSDILWYYAEVLNKTNNLSIAPKIAPKWLEPTYLPKTKELKTIFLRKTYNAVWFASQCKSASKREVIILELRQFISVDIFGECGTKEFNGNFGEILQNNYKFYLAFENSLCVDYVTDAIYTALEHFVIPVVYGGANYSRFLPPHSYINVEDFENVAALGTYLRKVSFYADEYLSYFWWKPHYRIARTPIFCNLCEFLHKAQQTEVTKIYSDIWTWWRKVENCRYYSKLKFNIGKAKKLMEYIFSAPKRFRIG